MDTLSREVWGGVGWAVEPEIGIQVATTITVAVVVAMTITMDHCHYH